MKDSKETLLSKLQKKFISDICTALITPVDFMNSYLEQGLLEEYKLISLRLKEFQTLYSNYVNHTHKKKPQEATRVTLEKYCEAHPLTSKSIQEVKRVVEGSDYYALILEMYNVFLKSASTKRRTVWFYGAPNAGKTCLSKLLG
ncbi:MAG TPA: hypothetical protein VD907_06900 [Verrucomicrobiae bacterium]|nr:hypothetical protein [Verrucomicrobiae bacterium]